MQDAKRIAFVMFFVIDGSGRPRVREGGVQDNDAKFNQAERFKFRPAV
jgi:hypothetical protein